jgi:hypothetical protein
MHFEEHCERPFFRSLPVPPKVAHKVRFSDYAAVFEAFHLSSVLPACRFLQMPWCGTATPWTLLNTLCVVEVSSLMHTFGVSLSFLLAVYFRIEYIQSFELA